MRGREEAPEVGLGGLTYNNALLPLQGVRYDSSDMIEDTPNVHRHGVQGSQ